MSGILHWIEGATGISTQAQVNILLSLLSAYGMNAIHLTKEHQRGVLSSLLWGLDGVYRLLGKVKPIFNEHIQSEIEASRGEIAELKSMVTAQQQQLDAVHQAVKSLKPTAAGVQP
jgi:hypothetical protein